MMLAEAAEDPTARLMTSLRGIGLEERFGGVEGGGVGGGITGTSLTQWRPEQLMMTAQNASVS